jgi:general secretion pathway protein G
LSDQRGFTLVELLVVCAILGVLATMAIPSYTVVTNSVRMSRCLAEVHVLDQGVASYAADQGHYPALITQVETLKTNFVDPWGHDYVYHYPGAYQGAIAGTPLNLDYDIYSVGMDGATTEKIGDGTSLDDIIRASEGGYVGKNQDL